jgi:hypothetical protein
MQKERNKRKNGYSCPCDGRRCAVGMRIHATTSSKGKQGQESWEESRGVLLLVEVK